MWIPARSHHHALNCRFRLTTRNSYILWVYFCHKLISRDTSDDSGGSYRLFEDFTRTKTKSGHSDSETAECLWGTGCPLERLYLSIQVLELKIADWFYTVRPPLCPREFCLVGQTCYSCTCVPSLGAVPGVRALAVTALAASQADLRHSP